MRSPTGSRRRRARPKRYRGGTWRSPIRMRRRKVWLKENRATYGAAIKERSGAGCSLKKMGRRVAYREEKRNDAVRGLKRMGRRRV